jgi:hypothetical protein
LIIKRHSDKQVHLSLRTTDLTLLFIFDDTDQYSVIMPPRLEVLIMRSLELSYVQARDIVQIGRTELNMKYSDPWTEELKERCEMIHKDRLEKGHAEQPAPICATPISPEEKEQEPNSQLTKNDDVDDVEEMHGSDDVRQKDEATIEKTTENSFNDMLKDEMNEDDGGNDNNIEQCHMEITNNNDDGDMDQSVVSFEKEKLVRRPSRASIYNSLEDSMWVQTDDISINGSDDEDSDDFDGEDSLFQKGLTIKTRSNHKEKQTNKDVGHDGDDCEGATEKRSSSTSTAIPKIVYVITFNDVPLEFLIEEAKRKSAITRPQSSKNTSSDTTPSSSPRRRSRSIGRKSLTAALSPGIVNISSFRGRSSSVKGRNKNNNSEKEKKSITTDGTNSPTRSPTTNSSMSPKKSPTKSLKSPSTPTTPQRSRSLSRGRKLLLDKLQQLSFRRENSKSNNVGGTDDDDDDDDEEEDEGKVIALGNDDGISL